MCGAGGFEVVYSPLRRSFVVFLSLPFATESLSRVVVLLLERFLVDKGRLTHSLNLT